MANENPTNATFGGWGIDVIMHIPDIWVRSAAGWLFLLYFSVLGCPCLFVASFLRLGGLAVSSLWPLCVFSVASLWLNVAICGKKLLEIWVRIR